MALSCFNIEKFFLNFRKRKPEKNSYISGKWNFLAPILKIYYIFSKESFSNISGNETFLYFM